jgi:hypothetical protein
MRTSLFVGARSAIAATLLLVLLVLSGCTAERHWGGSSRTGEGGKIKIGLVTKTESNPYFVKLRDAARAAADAHGAEGSSARWTVRSSPSSPWHGLSEYHGQQEGASDDGFPRADRDGAPAILEHDDVEDQLHQQLHQGAQRSWQSPSRTRCLLRWHQGSRC